MERRSRPGPLARGEAREHECGDDSRRWLEKCCELVSRERRLTKDRTQGAGSELSMHRNDDRPALFVPKFDVTSPLADLLEAGAT